MPDLPVLYRFDRLSTPLAFHGCSDLVALIAERVHGWAIAPWPASGAPEASITLMRNGAAYELRSRLISGVETYHDDADAVMAFMAELIMAYGAQVHGGLLLHSGGVVVRDRLLAFPASGRTGKSTLTAQMAARGARVFSDDVLPLDMTTCMARALGIEPRLRLPLPDTCSAAFRAWFARRMALANRRYAYLHLPRSGPGSLAPLGEERPIAAFVRLDRRTDARAELAPCPRADVMTLLIRQHFGTSAPMPEVVARLKDVVERAPCYRLTYADGEDGADLLASFAERAA